MVFWADLPCCQDTNADEPLSRHVGDRLGHNNIADHARNAHRQKAQHGSYGIESLYLLIEQCCEVSIRLPSYQRRSSRYDDRIRLTTKPAHEVKPIKYTEANRPLDRVQSFRLIKGGLEVLVITRFSQKKKAATRITPRIRQNKMSTSKTISRDHAELILSHLHHVFQPFGAPSASLIPN